MSERRQAFDDLGEVIDAHTDEHGPDDELTAIAGAAADHADENGDGHQHLLDRIRDAIHRFETEHIELTDSLNKVAYYLSGEGL